MSMSETMVERYRRWFEYEQDAHAKVLRSLESVPSDRRTGPEFQKALTLLAHIVAARRMWLFRFGVSADKPDQFFPQTSLPEVTSQLQAMQERWTDYLNDLTDEDLGREFEYQSLDAGRFRNRIEDILTQLFGHSWYHRGQIATLVRAAGGEPAATDFVYWCRESIP
jgi:uncharacterized damage-inducible protein DinB